MFLHLIGNDPKFPKVIREKYEVIAPGRHVYVIVKTHPDQPEFGGDEFTYVSSPEQLDAVVRSQSNWEAIIINGLLSRLVSFLPVLPLSLPVAYFIWGGEAYAGVFSGPDALYGPQTRAVVLNGEERIKGWLSLLFGARARQRRECRKVAKYIDIALFPIQGEVDLFIKRKLLLESTEAMLGNVGSGIDFEMPVFDKGISGENILIGNSADPTNNHLDTFTWLQSQQLDLVARKVIVPLSYGGNEEYKERVLTAGRVAFGEAFYPLLDFMPYSEYMDIVRSCRFVIMNHRRQQAAANVFTALALGASVYLNDETTLATGLKSMGFRIGSISCPEGLASGALMAIGLAEAEHNASLAREHFSREMSRLRAVALIDKLRVLN